MWAYILSLYIEPMQNTEVYKQPSRLAIYKKKTGF
jgi:hypothetical protein